MRRAALRHLSRLPRQRRAKGHITPERRRAASPPAGLLSSASANRLRNTFFRSSRVFGGFCFFGVNACLPRRPRSIAAAVEAKNVPPARFLHASTVLQALKGFFYKHLRPRVLVFYAAGGLAASFAAAAAKTVKNIQKAIVNVGSICYILIGIPFTPYQLKGGKST